MLAAVVATQRTSYYALAIPPPAAVLSLKFDPAGVPACPSRDRRTRSGCTAAAVEGVHLRFGAVARGGLRWSDRREDFRTEVLGLVKAQIVKNAVIVPTGAKGGFVAKRLPDPAVDRDAWWAEGVACYRTFISGLLDVTDNLAPTASGGGVPPVDVVRHDGDDPYLVVAADKGTATFSDIANDGGGRARLLARRRLRLRRLGRLRPQGHGHHRPRCVGVGHAALPGARPRRPDARSSPWSASATCPATSSATACCSRSTSAWSAAFDHRHVFLDPDPDAAVSFAERQRLFALPRSSWADYDPALISAGGGVYPRTAKSIPSRPRSRAALGLAGRRRVAARRRAGPRDPARPGRPALQRRHRHLRQGHDREPRSRSATRPTTPCGSTARTCASGSSARAATSA